MSLKIKTVCLWNTNNPGENKELFCYFKYTRHGHKAIDPGVTRKGFH